MGVQSGGGRPVAVSARAFPSHRQRHKQPTQHINRARLVDRSTRIEQQAALSHSYNYQLLHLLLVAATVAGAAGGQLRLSHHALCEPISQLADLRLKCAHESQFMVVLEAYYSDLYPEIVCPRAQSEFRLHKLTGSQLVAIFRQLYASEPLDLRAAAEGAGAPAPADSSHPLRFHPTLQYGAQRPFCLDDLKQSLVAKCSGRRQCRFARAHDHHFPACAQLKPGHAFLRYLCIDEALLVRYCNADAALASRSSAATRVKRHLRPRHPEEGVQAPDDGHLETADFGFVASPGYPDFYATPKGSCGWSIEAELGQRVTVKLLDASLAPHQARQTNGLDYTTSDSLLPYDEFSRPGQSVSRLPGELLASVSISPSGQAGAKFAPAQTDPTDRPDRANVQFETLDRQPQLPDGSSLAELLANLSGQAGPAPQRRIVFKIDEYDYEIIRSNLASKLQQVHEQCQGYDQLVVRDPLAGAEAANSEVGAPDGSSPASDELRLISRLPVSLYKQHLIDFANQTIFHAGPEQSEQSPSSARSIDYQALIAALNPLQLLWLYQHNVSLCSTGQQDQLSAPIQKNRISFTSSAHRIQVDLVSGTMFNPTNRGLLFWYHKHGCPWTRRLPARVRLVYRNETTEVFRCFPGFVFGDTRLDVRVRRCSQTDQLWRDAHPVAGEAGQAGLPRCVYVEELANQLQAVAPGQAKSERLTALHPGQLGAGASAEQLASAHEVAVEVVGVSTAPTPGHHVDLNSEVELFSGSAPNTVAPPPGQLEAALARLWSGMVGQLLPPAEPQDTPPRSITTHQPLREQRLPADDSAVLARTRSLLDRRLLVPAIAVLFLFILINLIIYVIFLVALPKLACLLCSRGGAKERAPDAQAAPLGAAHSSLIGSQAGEPNSKLAHYESEYSVSMGMSL